MNYLQSGKGIVSFPHAWRSPGGKPQPTATYVLGAGRGSQDLARTRWPGQDLFNVGQRRLTNTWPEHGGGLLISCACAPLHLLHLVGVKGLSPRTSGLAD